MRHKPKKQKNAAPSNCKMRRTPNYMNKVANKFGDVDPEGRENNRIRHFLIRLTERYHFRRLRFVDYYYVLKSIQAQSDHAIRCYYLVNPCTLYKVSFRNVWIYVVYDWDKKELRTVFPSDAPKILEWEEKVGQFLTAKHYQRKRRKRDAKSK